MQRIVPRAALIPALLVILATAGLAAAATMYRWVDANGVVHYSDTPQPGAEQVAMPNAQTYRATPVPTTSPDATPKAADAAGYQSCSITSPAADDTLFAPEALTVSVQVVPNLRPGDQVIVTLDGATLQSGSSGALSYQVAAPERGAHTVSAAVHDAQGNTVCNAPDITFNVQRPSLLSPQSPAKGH
ncbi:MAG: DUF4124 domain-containing protein [Steroidobacteraceae bacterium]|jgi:hypothetical protein